VKPGLAVLAACAAAATPAAVSAAAYQNMGLMRACLTVVEYAQQLGAAAAEADGAMARLERAMALDAEVSLFESAAGPAALTAMADPEAGLVVQRRRAAACAAHDDCDPGAPERAAAFATALKAACLTDYRSAP
jgi:surface antigen